MSPQACRILDLEEKENLGHSINHLVHPDDRSMEAAIIRKVWAKFGETVDAEFRMMHRDGSFLWVECSFRNCLEEPDIGGIVVNFHDVTERKNANELVRKSRENLELAQYMARLGSWELDPQSGEGLSWSKEMFALFGRDPAQGVPAFSEFIRFVQPDDRQALLAAYKRVAATEIGETVEYRSSAALSGEHLYLSTINAIKENGGMRKFLAGTVQDITEVRKAERLVSESEKSLKYAQQLSKIGSWEHDHQTNIMKCSDETFRIFGLDPAGPSSVYETFLERIHPEDRAAVDRAYRASIENHGPLDIMHRITTEDGTLKHVQERCETIYDGEGKPLRSMGTVQDITERRKMELEIGERVKELTCLSQVGRILEGYVAPEASLFESVAEKLGKAMRFPELAVPRIELDGRTYGPSFAEETKGKCLFSSIEIDGKARGRVMVFYARDNISTIPEEQELLDNLARTLGL
ncbi:MAG: PAS domain-containing protein [Spirochaetes bacterium]|nr:PAS domain-containing protein [Spirochaetota bacterium]